LRTSFRRRHTGSAKGSTNGGDVAQIVEQAVAVDRRLAEAGAQRIVVRADPVELRFRASRCARSHTRIARRPTLSS
jgi:hypothetical protein